MEKGKHWNDISLMVASIFWGLSFLWPCYDGVFHQTLLMGFSATCPWVFSHVILKHLPWNGGASGVLPEFSFTIPIHSYWVGAMVNGTFIDRGLLQSVCLEKTILIDLTGLTSLDNEEKLSKN